MSTLEIKKKLIHSIHKTGNRILLRDVYRLFELQEEDIEIYKLNPRQKHAINKGKKEIENGQFLSNEQAEKEADEWLKK